VQILRGELVAVVRFTCYHGDVSCVYRHACHSPDQRPNRFSVLRVSMVRMELCSTRTMGRSARRGIVGVVLGLRGSSLTVVPLASVTMRFRVRQWSCRAEGVAGDATALTDTWIDGGE